MPQEPRDTETEERECVHFPMRVQPVTTRAVSASALLALAKERAPDPSVFDEADPYLFTGVVSTDKVDSHSTRMDVTSLQNFAADMEAGVSLQNSHNTFELGLGRSLTGRSTRGKGSSPTRTEGEFFLLQGDATAEIVRKIQAGVVSDLSVGFYGGQWLCDICGVNIRNWRECPHYPGMEYVTEEGGEPLTATATIHNARLAEVSLVFSGSTPGAHILKAIRAVEAGELAPEKVRALEACYRTKLPGSRHIWAGADALRQQEKPMANEPVPAPAPEPVDTLVLQAFRRTITEALKDAGLDEAAEPASQVRAMVAELTELRPLRDKVTTLETRAAELEPQAKDGHEWRVAKVAEARGEYIRCYGNEVDADKQEARWMRQPMAEVLEDLKHYTERAAEKLTGGRVTADRVPEETPAPSPVPAYLYAA